MSEPTVPTPPAGYDPRPDVSAYPTNESYSAPRPADATPVFQQVYIEKAPEQLEGEKLAKTSTILGIVSIYFAGLILGPMAIIKAAKAEKLGVDSTVGKVTGWLGVVFGTLTIVVSIFYAFFFAALFAAAGMDSSDKIGTGGFSNSQELKQDQNNDPRSNFDKTYEKLTPAEKAQMDQMLEELDAEVSNR